MVRTQVRGQRARGRGRGAVVMVAVLLLQRRLQHVWVGGRPGTKPPLDPAQGPAGGQTGPVDRRRRGTRQIT